jgi:hypothetical protein
MWIYENFAQYGLPCPVTGNPPTLGQQAQQQAQHAAQQQTQPSTGS